MHVDLAAQRVLQFTAGHLQMRYLPALLAIVLLTLTALAGDTWPEFRGPHANGHADAKHLPSRWSETENIRWKTAIHGKGWSSPVIWGEQIWMTTAPPDGKELFAVCVHRQTGKIIHDIKVFSIANPAFCHAYNSYASCTPAIEAGRVYVHFGSAGTACIDSQTGKVLWQRQDLPCDHYRGPGSSPILYEGLLILLFDGFDQQYVAALDKASGKTVWKRERGIQYPSSDGDFRKAYATPAVLRMNGQPQLVCPAAEATFAYDPATGTELWRIVHGGMNVSSRPVFGHELIFLTSGHPMQLLAVRQGGRGELGKDSVVWKTNRAVPTRPSVLLVDDSLYMVADKGVASCLRVKSGELLWQERLGGSFSASPLYAAGHVYFADEEGKTHVLKPGDAFKAVAVNQLDAGCMASPAVVGNELFLRTKTHLYCISER
jgi:outer membrane protein assembly factor BamB